MTTRMIPVDVRPHPVHPAPTGAGGGRLGFLATGLSAAWRNARAFVRGVVLDDGGKPSTGRILLIAVTSVFLRLAWLDVIRGDDFEFSPALIGAFTTVIMVLVLWNAALKLGAGAVEALGAFAGTVSAGIVGIAGGVGKIGRTGGGIRDRVETWASSRIDATAPDPPPMGDQAVPEEDS